MGLAERLSARNRQKKWDRFTKEFAITQSTRILDVGFNETEYSSVDNFLERKYPYPEMITALGMEDPVQFGLRYPKVTAIKYDGVDFPFNSDAFDICWSNAVLEHVGDFDKQVNFLKEINRSAKFFYITTPNRYFPIEVHTRIPFLHWLPKRIFDWCLVRLGKEWAAGPYMNLLSFSDINRLCVSAGISEYQIIPNRLMGFSIDFVVMGRRR